MNPYLTVKGAADAIAFYQKAFGAKENARMPAQDGKRIMHACLTINGGAVMLSDEFPEYARARRHQRAEQGQAGAGGHVPPARQAGRGRCHVPACGRGGLQEHQGPEDTFWDARFAMLSDPFGHRWMLNAPLPKKPAAKKKQQPAG